MNRERRYPTMTPQLRSQLNGVQPSFDGLVHYYPCKVKLRNESWTDRVIIAQGGEYIRAWGVWPDQDTGKNEVKIEDVEEIQESPIRLPVTFTKLLYEAGESGMGYTLFALCYNDLSISYHVAGNLLDFVTLPEGKKINDLKTVLPHKKGDQTNLLRTPEYSWCLFSE